MSPPYKNTTTNCVWCALKHVSIVLHISLHGFTLKMLYCHLNRYWHTQPIIDREKMAHIQANTFICEKSSIKEKTCQ